jgi:hypothetical protein
MFADLTDDADFCLNLDSLDLGIFLIPVYGLSSMVYGLLPN